MIDIFNNILVWLVIGSPFIFIVIVVAINIKYKKKLSNLKQERMYENFETFTQYLAQGTQDEIDKQICLNVYQFLQQLTPIKDFPVRPSDSLWDLYGIGVPFNIYLDEVIDELSLQCWKRRFVDTGKIPEKLATVRDLVRFISQLGTK